MYSGKTNRWNYQTFYYIATLMMHVQAHMHAHTHHRIHTPGGLVVTTSEQSRRFLYTYYCALRSLDNFQGPNLVKGFRVSRQESVYPVNPNVSLGGK